MADRETAAQTRDLSVVELAELARRLSRRLAEDSAAAGARRDELLLEARVVVMLLAEELAKLAGRTTGRVVRAPHGTPWPQRRPLGM